MSAEGEPRHVKSTSLADYFAVPDSKHVAMVRQSNTNGVICCLTCLTVRCKHITAALPAIELHALAGQAEPITGESAA